MGVEDAAPAGCRALLEAMVLRDLLRVDETFAVKRGLRGAGPDAETPLYLNGRAKPYDVCAHLRAARRRVRPDLRPRLEEARARRTLSRAACGVSLDIAAPLRDPRCEGFRPRGRPVRRPVSARVEHDVDRHEREQRRRRRARTRPNQDSRILDFTVGPQPCPCTQTCKHLDLDQSHETQVLCVYTQERHLVLPATSGVDARSSPPLAAPALAARAAPRRGGRHRERRRDGADTASPPSTRGRASRGCAARAAPPLLALSPPLPSPSLPRSLSSSGTSSPARLGAPVRETSTSLTLPPAPPAATQARGERICCLCHRSTLASVRVRPSGLTKTRPRPSARSSNRRAAAPPPPAVLEQPLAVAHRLRRRPCRLCGRSDAAAGATVTAALMAALLAAPPAGARRRRVRVAVRAAAAVAAARPRRRFRLRRRLRRRWP